MNNSNRPSKSEKQALFYPAISLMNKLTYPKKFLLVGLFFALPLTLSLYLLVGEINDRIDFSQKEFYGNKILKPLRLFLENLQIDRGLTLSLGAGTSFVSADRLKKSEQAIIGSLERVDAAYEELKLKLPVSARRASFSSAIRASRQKNGTRPNFKDSSQQISELLNVITDVADQSNLILDPDLDSYYLMDLIVSRLPNLSEQIGQARAWGTVVVANKMVTQEDSVYLSGLVGLIIKSREHIAYDVEVIFRENPDLKLRLGARYNQSVRNTDAFLHMLKNRILASSAVGVRPEEYWETASTALTANFMLYDAASASLDEVLQQRINRFKQKRNFVLFFTLVMTLIALYLLTAFYWATMRLVSSFELITKNMITGSGSEVVVLPDTHDEMSRVAESFAKLAASLKNERDDLALLIHSAPFVICGISGEGQTLFINPFGESLTGYQSSDIVGRDWWQTFYPGDEYRQVEKLFINFKKGDVRDYEMTLTSKDGQKKIVSWNSFNRLDKAGALKEIVGFGNDITIKRRAERRLGAQHAVNAALVQLNNLDETMEKITQAICENLDWQVGAFWKMDIKDGTLHCVNIWHAENKSLKEFVEATRLATFKQGVGFPGRIFKSRKPAWILDILKDDNFPRAPFAAKAGIHSGSGFPIVIEGEVFGVMEFFFRESWTADKDLIGMLFSIGVQIGQFIQQKQLSAQLLQSQKMETLGVLAGGIAHDLNNQLTPVRGYTDLLLQDTDSKHPHHQMLTEVNLAIDRCADIIRRLKNFSAPTSQKKDVVAVSGLFKEFEAGLKKFLPTSIVVKFTYEKDVWPIEVNETEMQTVFMNLAVNARDAMSGDGHLFIDAKNVDLEDVRDYQGEPLRKCVLISMADNGGGMSPELLERVFEPFFTTKEKGKGTGLGLSMARKIIQDHRGRIDIVSEVGKGTTFNIYLPAKPAAVVVPEKERDTARRETGILDSLLAKNETVLLADDEASVRDLGKVFLKRLGYKVLEAINGEEVVSLYQKNLAAVDVLMLDMTMPKMTGVVMIKKILEINAKAKIILVSGYTTEGTPQELIQRGAKEFIQKPYTIMTLAPILRRVIDE